MAYADTVTLSCLGSAVWQPIRGEDAHWRNPSSPNFAWSLLGIKLLLDRCRAEGRGTEVDMGLGRDNEAALKNAGCISRLALYHWSPHQYARVQEGLFPTSLGSSLGPSGNGGEHGDSSFGWESWSSSIPLQESSEQCRDITSVAPVAHSHRHLRGLIFSATAMPLSNNTPRNHTGSSLPHLTKKAHVFPTHLSVASTSLHHSKCMP